MHHLPYADYFLTGSVLTIVMPTVLLISLAIWYVIAVKRVPEETHAASPTTPPAEVIDAAGPHTVSDVSPADPPADGR